MQKITPCLWFDDQGEEAAKFYVSIFKDSKILETSHYGDGAPMPKGTVMTVKFRLGDQEYLALNGGPAFHFSEAVSLVINCETQAEVDHYWEKLLAGGGKESVCGWLKDKFGFSWQVTPTLLPKLLMDKDEAKANRVMQAMMKMVKIDIATLKKAAEG